jgi:hypothetical protein
VSTPLQSPDIRGTPFTEDISGLVKAAELSGQRARRQLGFQLTEAGVGTRYIAVLLGLYLGWVVARVPEVFPQVFVPRLPMISMGIFSLALIGMVPREGWVALWRASIPFRCVATLYALAWITAPLGIWMSGSIDAAANRYLIAIITFLACFVFLRDRQNLRIAVALFVLCTATIAAYTLVTYDPSALAVDAEGIPLAPDEISIDRLRINVSVSLDPNDWGAVLTATIPLALWLGASARAARPFWMATALLLTAAIVPTQSRGSLLGLVAAAIVLVGVGAKGWKRLIMLGLIISGGLLFALVASDGQLGRFFDFGTDDYNVAANEGRLYFWRQGVVWMIKRPWGYGLDNYPTYFGWLNGPDRAAHSSWVQYGVELGIAGLSLFVMLVVSLWKGLRIHRRLGLAQHVPHKIPGEREATLAGHVLATLAATLVTGSFLSNAYYPLMYMSLGIAAAVLVGSPFQGATIPSGPNSHTSAPPGRRRPPGRGSTLGPE